MLSVIRSSLTVQMIVATLVGILTGLFLGDLCTVFAPWENAYIMILKITTIPYLISAVIHGLARLIPSTAKEILKKGLIFIAAAWIINIAVVYLVVYLFPQSNGSAYHAYSSIAPTKINFAELLIPDNIFYALSNNVIPAVVIFGLLTGLALMQIKEKQAMVSLLDTLVEALTRVTAWVSRLAPLGTFLIIADRVGTIQFSTFMQLGTYFVLYISALCLVVFWIVPRLVGTLTSYSPTKWIRDLTPVLILGFTTNITIVTLPFIIELIKKETEKLRKDPRLQEQIQGVVSIIFNVPLSSLFITVFIFFTAFFYHAPLTLKSQLQLFITTFLTSLGSVGIGSWINSLNFLLDTLGLPLTAIDTFLATIPFTAGFQSLVSVIEIASLSLLTILACHKLIQWNWKSFLLKTTVTCIPILLFIFTFKCFIKLPPISNPAKTICDLEIQSPVKVTVYSEENLPTPRTGDPLSRILTSKIVRVGYSPEMIPFSFLSKGKILGYDIAFAYALAQDLGCDLELVPIRLSHIAEDLQSGLYDIAMSGISITEKRLTKVCFSQPYLDSRVVFVMRKKFSQTYKSLADILKTPHIKVVVRKNSSYESLARNLLPADQIVSIEKYSDYIDNYPNDILLRGEPGAIAWTLNHPNFTVVSPSPGISQDSFAYPVALGSDSLLCFLNQWLLLKKNEKFTEQQYNLWVLGKTDTLTPQERRWSIIRDVLGWTEN